MLGAPDFRLIYTQFPTNDHTTVTCVWEPDGVRRAEETVQLPDTYALCNVGRLMGNDADPRAYAANLIADITELLARRVVVRAQRLHWKWSARVVEADITRFLRKTVQQPPPGGRGLTTSCRMWNAAVSTGGNKGSREEPYGSFWIGGTSVRAHIFSGVMLGHEEKLIMPHLPGHHLDHICRRTLCVERTHLESVTQTENERRKLEARGGDQG